MSLFLFPFVSSLPRLNPTAIIDILGVAFIIYQLLMIVRGTRAGHILIGILTMVLVFSVSVWFGLEALRSLLARIGRKRWFGGGFKRPESVDEILLALSRLSRDKNGALIVLERDIGLRTFVESGVRLDAEISADLLLSIFQPGGALHDGAVIVQKDRISSAACFLPLTTNPAIPANLGTRHRAAIGITEESDCMSLVVSEETGDLSMAAFGEIHQALSLREVDELINSHFGVGKPGAQEPGSQVDVAAEQNAKVEKAG